MAFVEVARLDEITDGDMKVVEVGGEEIALCRVGGKVYAISNRCTHDGGSLGQGETMGYLIECPRHGSRFDVRTGRVLTLPAEVDLETFPVRVVDDAVQVEVGA